jgi:iron complex transport system ATP-binding protein
VLATRHDLSVTAVPALEFVGVDLVEQGSVVLRDVHWRVGADERWVVLGPNGSGKTSLLRLAAFQRAPSSGTVTVLGSTHGRVDVRVARRRVGLASSATLQRLRPTLTAHDAVVTGLDAALEPWWSRYDDSDHDRADALLASVGCAGHAAQELATLSEGERKRVLVARLLMAEPELLLFDEPCAGLDLGGREAVVALLGELARAGGRPLVLVTHHVEEIPPGMTHVMLLRAGSVVAVGPIAATLTAPAISETFGVAVALHVDRDRYAARVLASEGTWD